MPILAMNSMARAVPPWIGCQHDGPAQRARHQGQLFERIAAIGHFGRQGVVLALVRKALLVECLKDDLDLLLKELAVGGLVEERRPKRLDLTGVIAAPDAKHDPSAGQDISHGVVFGEPQRMPHRGDIEAAADIDVARQMGEMHRHRQQVRNAFVTFVLEMVLGHPECVVAEPVHQPCHGFSLVESSCQMLVRKAAIVYCFPP
jgi:hypothetical protein